MGFDLIELEASCRAALEVLDRTRRARAAALARARDGWEGPHRDRYDDEERVLAAAADRIAARLARR